MSDWKQSLEKVERESLNERAMPDWTNPMKATLTEDYFSDPDWIYEPKFDGERALIFCRNGRVSLYSRNQKKLNNTYPELVEALEKKIDKALIADGEIVAFEGSKTSFSRLQGRIGISDPEEARDSGISVYFYLFDLLHFDGYDLCSLKLESRKKLLQKALEFDDPIRFTSHRREDGEKYHREACDKGWEGIIAKRADSSYRHSRSRDWLKFKCVNQQEFVIGGYTDPEGERKGFGALLVGYYEKEKLQYAGKIGTGFDDQTLGDLQGKLKKIQSESSPFDVGAEDAGSNVHWVKPKLVCEVGFTEWTRDGRLRHPRYLGLREDKAPKNVVRELPK